ncbi:MAG: DNA methylase [Lachnospiraceae bacterium]|nr:DNA methylase [Lachnospiraceae bacterium]
MSGKTYIAIDLKSFYASVECVERGLDPLKTNLVVADPTRTEKTICLAVSPSLKSYDISGRSRLFEVVERVKEVNAMRQQNSPGRKLTDSSSDDPTVRSNPSCRLDYITAPPRMALYMEYSTRIYDIYLKYISADDMHVYSVDEVFMDVTAYLRTYNMTAHELAMTMIHDVLKETGITATAGIGTNMYLCKIAMDIVAKHMPADKDDVRIAELDEMSYRKLLWDHSPITDFWRIGRGYAHRLAEKGMYTMGDVARCSVGKPDDYYNEDLLYKMFGINAELLIDHAWGWEPCTIKEIKEYRPESRSLSTGQVLSEAYDFEKGKLIVREMTDLLVLDLVEKGLLTNQMILTVCYDTSCLTNPDIRKKYKGPISMDPYGRPVPKNAHGTINLTSMTSSTDAIMKAVTELYEKIVDRNLLVRRAYVVANNVTYERILKMQPVYEQLDLFTDYEAALKEENAQSEKERKERRIQEALLSIKERYGKNAVLKGMNLKEGAKTIERNQEVGGHKA